ncbi:MAG TPA: hypothetical protein VF649_13270 [Sphingomonas sp.]|uniref:hypothetical protein n=1 Tax=Sphingomonas sp. TaxID=28214 RepID=UPI002ED8DFED
MTASDLHTLFVTTLLREVGGLPRHWRRAIGDIRCHSIATHPHCNWSIHPAGSADMVDAIENLADRLRARHPIITAD